MTEDTKKETSDKTNKEGEKKNPSKLIVICLSISLLFIAGLGAYFIWENQKLQSEVEDLQTQVNNLNMNSDKGKDDSESWADISLDFFEDENIKLTVPKGTTSEKRTLNPAQSAVVLTYEGEEILSFMNPDGYFPIQFEELVPIENKYIDGLYRVSFPNRDGGVTYWYTEIGDEDGFCIEEDQLAEEEEPCGWYSYGTGSHLIYGEYKGGSLELVDKIMSSYQIEKSDDTDDRSDTSNECTEIYSSQYLKFDFEYNSCIWEISEELIDEAPIYSEIRAEDKDSNVLVVSANNIGMGGGYPGCKKVDDVEVLDKQVARILINGEDEYGYLSSRNSYAIQDREGENGDEEFEAYFEFLNRDAFADANMCWRGSWSHLVTMLEPEGDEIYEKSKDIGITFSKESTSEEFLKAADSLSVTILSGFE